MLLFDLENSLKLRKVVIKKNLNLYIFELFIILSRLEKKWTFDVIFIAALAEIFFKHIYIYIYKGRLFTFNF